MRLKSIEGKKTHLFACLRFCACEEKANRKKVPAMKHTKNTDAPTTRFM